MAALYDWGWVGYNDDVMPAPTDTPRTSRLMVVLFAALLILSPVPGAPEARAQGLATLSEDDRADISRIEKYLNTIKTLQARFLQVSSDGGFSEGALYFSKPGKMRLEYDDPNPMLIVADGSNLGFYDKELDQVSYFDLDATQAAVLLKENISFSSGGSIVTAFERGPGVLRLTVIKGSNPLEGNITLIFSDRPLSLKKWTVTDAQGVITNISLLDPRFGVTLSQRLFEIQETPNFLKN
ncbi:MAG: outer membrane lipoprotein carrier protein LolA [Proteobacteria bacterium]|nr:outer membrane lipoprotein carrier protein LolA [Pseudomonadota bacterium]